MAVYKAPDDPQKNKKKDRKKKQAAPQNTNVYRPSGRHTKTEREEYYRQKELAHKKRRNRVLGVIVVLLLIVAAVFAIMLIGRGMNAEKDAASKTPTEPTNAASAPGSSSYTPEKVNLPELADDGSEGAMDGSIYVWNKQGFDIFKGNEKTALSYSDAVSSYKKALGDGIKVYNMVIPNHTEFGLPQRLSTVIGSNPQRDNTTVIYSNYSAAVTPVDIYNALGQKRNEYIFFHTDYRWTSLGAYYAYEQFAKTAGFEPTALGEMDKNTISDFAGSYVTSTWNEQLSGNLDTIDYYTMPADLTCTLYRTDEDGNTSETPETVGLYKEVSSGEDFYNVFLYGDNANMVIDNQGITNGDKIALVKDMYGNAFAPFLSNNYDEVHVIDFRYFKGNLKEYCEKNKIKTVLFLNGVMSANSALQIENMNKLFQ